MRKVRIRYHYEPEGWWAESPDVPGFSAAGATFMEVRQLAFEGIEFACEEPVAIVEEGVFAAAQRDQSDTPIEVRTKPGELRAVPA